MERSSAATTPFRHDRLIVVNELRWALASWTDRLVACSAILIALLAVRAALNGQSVVVATWLVAAFGATFGIGTATLIRRRLQFHGYDGVLAAAALDPVARRRYSIATHAIALGLLGAVVLVARYDRVAFGLAGYLAGVAASDIVGRLLTSRSLAIRPMSLRLSQAWRRHPASGALAAGAALILLLSLRRIDSAALIAVAGASTVTIVLSLTTLDHATVRFMAIAGRRSWASVLRHAWSALAFGALAVSGLLIAALPQIAAIVGGLTLAGLILMAIRLLSYRVHSKRVAETVAGCCMAALCGAGFVAPIFLPLLIAAIFWHLYRQSARQTWLLE